MHNSSDVDYISAVKKMVLGELKFEGWGCASHGPFPMREGGLLMVRLGGGRGVAIFEVADTAEGSPLNTRPVENLF